VSSGKFQGVICTHVVGLLREERARLKLSKYQVAARCGISQQMIGYIERGLRSPSLEVALRLADGLDMKLEEVIKRARKAALNTAAAKRRQSAKS